MIAAPRGQSANDVTDPVVTFSSPRGEERGFFEMVTVCCVVGCKSRFKKGLSKGFYKIPKVVVHQGPAEKDRTERRL